MPHTILIQLNNFICALGLLLADLIAWVISYAFAGKSELPVQDLFVLTGMWLAWHLLVRRKYMARYPFWSELLSLIKGVTAFMLVGMLSSLLGRQSLDVWVHLQWGLILLIVLVIARSSARAVLRKLGLWSLPTLIFGADENAQQAALALQSEISMGYTIDGFVVPPGQDQQLPQGYRSVAWPQHAQDFDALMGYRCVIALEASQSELRDTIIRQLSQYKITNVSVIPSMRGVPLFGLETTQFFSHEVLMLHLRNQLARPALRLIKRLFDFVGSAVLLLLLSPLFAYVAWKVSRDGGSAFFGHERVGQDGRKFKCYKFRSMVVNAQEVLQELLARDPVARAEWEKDFKLKNDPRINPIGHFLRRTSLDELPQLWNVLKGEMSLVGPRPVVQDELARYGQDVVFYLMAKPGMTGLWQVSGRNDVDYDTRVYFDAWYVKNWSLWTDIAILFKTISVVTGRRGAY